MTRHSGIFFILAAVCLTSAGVLFGKGMETKRDYVSLANSVVTVSQKQEDPLSQAGTDKTSSEGEPSFHIDFATLHEINPDVVGWLIFEDGDISLPVVQEQTPDEYMGRTFEGKQSHAGCLFIQSGQSPDFTDSNTIIYGHNMTNGSMFGKLKTLVNHRQSLHSPYFDLYLPDGTKNRYRIVSMYVTDKNSKMYRSPNGYSDMENYIQKSMDSGSTVGLFPLTDTEQKAIADGNPMVTLSTCYGFQGTPKRTLIQGILCEG